MDGLLLFQVVPQNQLYGLHIPGLGLHPETNRFSGRNGAEGMSEERVAGVMLQLVPVDIVVQPFRRGGWIFPECRQQGDGKCNRCHDGYHCFYSLDHSIYPPFVKPIAPTAIKTGAVRANTILKGPIYFTSKRSFTARGRKVARIRHRREGGLGLPEKMSRRGHPLRRGCEGSCTV